MSSQRPSGSAPRPIHLRLGMLLLVFLGGSLGTAARQALLLLFPELDSFPLTIFLINICGAFMLGALLEHLARRGPDTGASRRVRLMFGTGFMGGFTTYSTLATQTALLATAGHGTIALLYALGTVLVGALATFTGIACAVRIRRGRVKEQS